MESALFASYWLAGFESAYHINRFGERLDMVAATQHDRFAGQDYAMLRPLGIRTVREACRWYLIDRGGGRYDFASLEPMVNAAERHGMQVIWTLCHYGWPEGLDIFTPAFVDRFRMYARAVARYLRERSDAVPFFMPVNEISFFSWAAARYMHPFAKGRDTEIKLRLARAAIAACEAVRDVDRRARLCHGEPIINVLPPRSRPDMAERARQWTEGQFEAFDLIGGYAEPMLGGKPEYLDILGGNFYHDNQWVLRGKKIWWHEQPRDPRYVDLHLLLRRLHDRYRRPVFLSETSHFGRGRGRWIKYVAAEVCRARQIGVPVEGICLYPILDRHDWEDPKWWHHSGLWDLKRERRGVLRRVLNKGYAVGLARAQDLVAACGAKRPAAA